MKHERADAESSEHRDRPCDQEAFEDHGGHPKAHGQRHRDRETERAAEELRKPARRG
jgi:hypothetical protein